MSAAAYSNLIYNMAQRSTDPNVCICVHPCFQRPCCSKQDSKREEKA